MPRSASMKRSTMRGFCERATRCRITSVSEVDWQIAPVRDQLAPQRQAVGEVAIVRDREAAGGELGEQRLHIAQDGLAGGRIAHMADRALGPGAVSMIARLEKWSPTRPRRRSEWKRPPSKETMPAASWPRCWSAWRPSAVSAAASSMAEDAEDAAFLAQRVAVEIESVRSRFGSHGACPDRIPARLHRTAEVRFCCCPVGKPPAPAAVRVGRRGGRSWSWSSMPLHPLALLLDGVADGCRRRLLVAGLRRRRRSRRSRCSARRRLPGSRFPPGCPRCRTSRCQLSAFGRQHADE